MVRVINSVNCKLMTLNFILIWLGVAVQIVLLGIQTVDLAKMRKLNREINQQILAEDHTNRVKLHTAQLDVIKLRFESDQIIQKLRNESDEKIAHLQQEIKMLQAKNA